MRKFRKNSAYVRMNFPTADDLRRFNITQIGGKHDPNKVQNPMMWPFDKPGAVWTHDSVDTSRDPERFPYNTEALHDDVYAAEETPAFADGVWHRASNQGSFRREYTKKAR